MVVNSADLQNPFEIPRDQVNGFVLPSSKRTFTSDDLISGTTLGSKGYLTYTQGNQGFGYRSSNNYHCRCRYLYCRSS